MTHGRCPLEVSVTCWDVVPTSAGCLIPGLTHVGANLELGLGDSTSGQDGATETESTVLPETFKGSIRYTQHT